MNKVMQERLRVHFSDAQVRAFFGARSDDELDTIMHMLDGLTPDKVAAFKRQCGALYRQQQAIRTRRNPKNRNRKRFSVMGRLLVQDAKERRA